MTTARHPEDPTIEERLRLNAEQICKQVGDGWRRDAAEAMGCAPADVGAGPVSRHRDSEPLAESNFRVVLGSLKATDERVREARFRHWGFGWTEEIVVPLDNPAVVQQVESWVSALQDYPAVDDHDLAELEAEQEATWPAVDPDDDDGRAPLTSESDTAARRRHRFESIAPRRPVDPPCL